ncbi:hypothetical protein [Leifsonia xyli]|uniref:hypothetical protein n=1 Tax=Leifsonia xyli TaxID=1575 RepID=UPI003D663F06
MTVRSAYRLRVSRRWGVATLVAACVALGALVGLLVIPQYVSNAGNTAVSTLYKTATNTVNGSVAASLDAPGGTKTGTAKPGDTIKWAVSYQNNTSAAATVDLKDVIANAGTYVNGSLQLPPNLNAVGSLSPQYTTNGGTSWVNGTPRRRERPRLHGHHGPAGDPAAIAQLPEPGQRRSVDDRR